MVCSSSVPIAPRLLLTLALIFFFLLPTVLAQDLLATLDYGSFQGAYDSAYNISYWQKIPFAQPPLGPLRFRGPQPPSTLPNGTVYNSTQTFDMCVQRTVNGTEDCLYLGLYSRPWTTDQPLRPVVVVFYGGAYIQGTASFTLPPSAYPVLNVSGDTELVFVYSNYRTNAFGFLSGREIGADRNGSDLNPGLLDQDAAIKCECVLLLLLLLLLLALLFVKAPSVRGGERYSKPHMKGTFGRDESVSLSSPRDESRSRGG